MKIYPKLDFVCTTGRRLNLFEKTIRSFSETCLDRDLINKTIIVDDRSNKKDLSKMQKILVENKFQNISVNPNLQLGQLNSIKLAISLVETEYVFWCEDDWKWLRKDHFIQKAFNIFFSDERIQEVTFRFWECMFVKDRYLEYRMHVYSPLDYKKQWDIIKYNDCTYWGLSFNPGIISVDVLKKCLEHIEQDNPENRGWDKEVSKKFWTLGYRRANLMDQYIEHIGDKISYYRRNK